MFSTTDTIVAIATPPGRGAVGLVRLSGPLSLGIGARLLRLSRPLRPRYATRAQVAARGVRDEVIATYFPAPASYTGDDVLELSAHGSDVVLQSILAAAMDEGARLAAPGEFTLRAYLNGKLDLVQSEAVADLIDAATPLQAASAFDQLNGTLTTSLAAIDQDLFALEAELEASVDFPDEGYHFIDRDVVSSRVSSVIDRIDRVLAGAARGRLIREGARVVFTGVPNAGKSSLFNALVGARRAIVSQTPGTTRDLLVETVDLGDLRVTLVDTAGLADSADEIERAGIALAREALADATVVVVVSDSSRERVSIDVGDETRSSIEVGSKADLPRCWEDPNCVLVSTVSGEGLDVLAARIRSTILGEEDMKDVPAISNLRHIALLESVRDVLAGLNVSILDGVASSEEFVLMDLRAARLRLEELTGRRGDDDLLAHIFSRFCIGK